MDDKESMFISSRRHALKLAASTTAATTIGTAPALAQEQDRQQWKFETEGFIFSSLEVKNGTVFVGPDTGNIYALSAADGSEQWRFQTGNAVSSSPAVVDGTVYVGSDDNNVYALSAADGSEQWRFQTGNAVSSSPAVVDGTVYVGSDDANVYALDATAGTEQWKAGTNRAVDSSPAVADGTVYGGASDIYAWSASDGNVEWVSDITMSSSPTIADGTVYIGSSDPDNIYALSAANGSEQWRFQTERLISSSPVVVGSTVYVASVEGNVYALNTDTSGENDSDDIQREENNSSIEVEFDNVNEENKLQVANTEEAQVSGTITNVNTFILYMYRGNYPIQGLRVDVSTDDSFSTEFDFSDAEVGSELRAVVRTEDNAELDTTDVVVVEPPVMPESESETAEVNLRIYNFDVPDSVAPNSTFVVSGSVENTGEADASGRATLSVEGETLDSADSIEANSLTTLSGSVNAGEAGSSKTVTIEIPNGGSESQTITVETRTDADTDRAETNTDADTDKAETNTDADTDADNTQSNSDEEDASSNEDFDIEEEILELISRLFG